MTILGVAIQFKEAVLRKQLKGDPIVLTTAAYLAKEVKEVTIGDVEWMRAILTASLTGLDLI